MKQPRTGIRITRPKKTTKEHERIIHMIPTPKISSKVVIKNTTEVNSIPTHGPTTIPFEDESSDDQVNNIFCSAELAESRTGTFYTDSTSALPEILLDGHQYYFIAYDY